MSEESCIMCKFGKKEGKSCVICRRFPPPNNSESVLADDQPTMTLDGWCGEFQPHLKSLSAAKGATT